MDYKDSLNLPQTSFPMKANLKITEEKTLKEWEENKIYEKMARQAQKRSKTFILHDGPPYANGHTHLGTALNKILKDIIVRFKFMSGYNTPFIPGWDCHGLPIEHNVDKTLKSKDSISKSEKRRLCRDYANKFVEIQRQEFKRLGSIGRYDNPYLTMNYSYEANTVRKLADFIKNGGLYRANKPIYWCSSCKTALAEAEVEYAQRSSPSIYVKFRIKSNLEDVIKSADINDRDIFAVIWTTTPWTIPSNLAISLNPDFEYSFVDNGEEIFIIEESLVDELMKKFGYQDYKVIAGTNGKNLENKIAAHPFINRNSLLILGSHVKKDAGTGLVHTAPGHGDDDYAIGLKYNLPAYAPVDNEGRFLKDVDTFAGMHVFESNPHVIEKLKEAGALVLEEKIDHSYPHCWRCKNPVILRSTKQWFISMGINNLRDKSLKEIKSVNWIPKWGIDRISGMLETRPDWCVSRQRSWGVPITAFYCKNCGEAFIDYDLTLKIAGEFEKYGADLWFDKPADYFINLREKEVKCKKCGSREFEKEEDILDVWFDSGVSYYCVLKNDKELKSNAFAFPADLYLEGSDQHRGWFHSSLLIGVGTGDGAPYKTVLTHGFVVDSSGKKMSKSLGNVISPDEIINKYGADILRLWAASEDYKNDMRISQEIIQRLSEGYRKIRNTLRFMLGNLNDFDDGQDAVKYENMGDIDKYALHRLVLLSQSLIRHYSNYDFHLVYQNTYKFIIEFSSFYLDIVKDILYTDAKNSVKRRAVQSVLHFSLNIFVKFLAPIMPFSASEAWGYFKKSGKLDNIFLERLDEPVESYVNFEIAEKLDKLIEVRDVVLSSLEKARDKKFIGSSLEARVILKASNEDYDLLNGVKAEVLKDLFIVSGVAIERNNMADFNITEAVVEKAEGEKCARCWKYDASVGKHTDYNDVCDRCHDVLINL
ncbi:MAG: isoleucine--tRNA ligase [Deltaproteobacteria bacterium]|nr:isoleucine--tRNA ligase [Deltaproteobacteria bacterium]